MLGVLEIVLRQNPVAGGRRVPGQLLVLLEDMLGVAPHLDAVRAVRIEGAVRIVLLGFIPAASAIAPALTLHALEISHIR